MPTCQVSMAARVICGVAYQLNGDSTYSMLSVHEGLNYGETNSLFEAWKYVRTSWGGGLPA